MNRMNRFIGIVALLAIIMSILIKARAFSGLNFSEPEMCRARWVFIGSAVESQVYEDEWPPVATAVTLSVDAIAHGEPPPKVVVRFTGGTLNGITVSPNDPMMAVGSRYLVVASPITPPIEGSVLPRDGTVIVAWWLLDEKAMIPRESLMQAIWKEHCDPAVDPKLNPTKQFLNIIPKDILEWCQHY